MKRKNDPFKTINIFSNVFTTFLNHTSYDVIVTLGPDEVLEKFRTFNARVVFGAEDFCWPDIKLKVKI